MATMSPGEYSKTEYKANNKNTGRTRNTPPWWTSNEAKLGFALAVLSGIASLLFSTMQFAENFGELKAKVAATENLIHLYREDIRELSKKIDERNNLSDRQHEEIIKRLDNLSSNRKK
jgi:hypothetical protein